MAQITFEVRGNRTYFSCGCVTDVIGENFLIDPCSLQCEVYLYCIEQSKLQGNIISYQMTKMDLSQSTNIPEKEESSFDQKP